MSALSIGASAVPNPGEAEKSTANPGPGGKFTKWIPGDAIAFYTAILVIDGTAGTVTSLVTSDAGDNQKLTEAEKLALLRQVDVSAAGWFWFAMAVAVGLVFLGAAGQRRRAPVEEGGEKIEKLDVFYRCALTAVAFALWSSLLPASWPNSLEIVQDMGSAYVLVVGALAAVFTVVADLLAPSFKAVATKDE